VNNMSKATRAASAPRFAIANGFDLQRRTGTDQADPVTSPTFLDEALGVLPPFITTADGEVTIDSSNTSGQVVWNEGFAWNYSA
jgi:hypothetical protein